MVRGKKRLWLFVIFILFGSCCLHIELYHHGIVRDAETQAPLKDAAVFLRIDHTCYLPPNPAGPNSSRLGFQETFTDNRGKYWLSMKLYVQPPLICLTDKLFRYFKPGYFERIYDSEPDQVDLYRMTHYLNYLPYRDQRPYYYSTSWYPDKCNNLQIVLDTMKNMKLEPVEENGIFLRLVGRKLTRMYSKINRSGGYLRDKIYFVYDEASADWIAIDRRGRMVDISSLHLPDWDFLSSDLLWGWPIYANKDSIFYPVEQNPIPQGLKYEKGEIRHIAPHKGNISALAGTLDNFFTIEDNGTLLCNYGASYMGRHFYGTKSQEKKFIGHFLKKYFKGANLPSSKEDDGIEHSLFKHLVQVYNHGYLVVTQTPNYWHVYSIGRGYDKKIQSTRLMIKEVASFPGNREICAIAQWGYAMYIAFKEEGIRKYNPSSKPTVAPKEDRIFFENSQGVLHSDVCSLVCDYAVNVPVVYATTGEDKIYRFSNTGIPDYQVKPN